MPYIKEEIRKELDNYIDSIILCLKKTSIMNNNVFHKEQLSNEELLNITGNINYILTRICAGICGKVSYPRIAIITGVLENVKQEFYRRIASPYEDQKKNDNGDIKEYKGII